MAARPRLRNLEPERQHRLFEAAGLEFAERGYGAASVNRILAQAGLSKGVLYYYFEDKADLFRTTLERAVESLFASSGIPGGVASLETWVAGLDAGSFWDGLRDMSRRSLGMLRSDAWYVRLARRFHHIRQEPGVARLVDDLDGAGRRMLEALLKRGRELGVVRSDLPLDFLVECALATDHAADRWILARMDDMGDAELAALMDARMDLFRDMLDEHRRGGETR